MMIEMRQEVHSLQFKGNIFFGSEAFFTANLLNQKLYNFDNFEINAGMSTITIGTHNEFSSA
jgi:hypothetical protein